MKRYLTILIGCLIVGVSYNVFFLPYSLVPNGINGLGALFNYKFSINPAYFLLIINASLIILSFLTLGKEKTKKYLISSLVIPIIILLSQKITTYIKFDNIELILLALSGAFMTGYGYSLIYKEGFSIGGIEIIQDIINSVKTYQSRVISYILEFIIISLAIFIIGLENAIYSSIIIAIILYLSRKSKIGISSNKTFFIITSKEEEVKDYLINDLKYDYTEFKVKGGFTNQKNKIIMTVIDTKDYYKLKEGITLMDPKAFISIIDNYESINKNISLNKENDE